MKKETCDNHPIWDKGLADDAIRNICTGCNDSKGCTKDKKRVRP